jgi:hypothetical protein
VVNGDSFAFLISESDIAPLGSSTQPRSVTKSFACAVNAQNKIISENKYLNIMVEQDYSTVTLLARFRGLSTSVPLAHAV